MIITIARRELRNLFISPLAWTILSVILAILAYLFLIKIELYMGIQPKLLGLSKAPGITDLIIIPLLTEASSLLLLICPLISMQLFSGERQQHTLSLLFSAPLSISEIVLGKYLGNLAFFLIILGFISLLPLSLLTGASLDSGRLCAALLGLALLLASFSAIGLFMSSLTNSPTIAAISTFGVLLLLWVIDWSSQQATTGETLLPYISMLRHHQSFMGGLVNSMDLFYYLLLIIMCLGLTIHHLDSSRRPHHSFKDRAQKYGFILLFLFLIGSLHGLNQRYNQSFDWTDQDENSISAASKKLIAELSSPLKFLVFTNNNQVLRSKIEKILTRYQRHNKSLMIEFINPDLHPELVREYDIQLNGAVVIQYQGRSERIQRIDEATISNALARLIQQQEQWLMFLTGHGERSPFTKRNHDLSILAQSLQQQGINLQQLKLTQTLSIPDNTQTLVIASPQNNLLPTEINIIKNYIDHGGNLLWLTEPGKHSYLDKIEQLLGIHRLPGIAVDANSLLLDIGDPSFVYIIDYPQNAISSSLLSGSLFPKPVALENKSDPSWEVLSLLQTGKRSWSETGTISDTISFDPDTQEQAGPLSLGYSLQRGQQRIVIIGDGDFISNAYIGNGSNLELITNIIHWLNYNDSLIDIPLRDPHDVQLNLSQNMQYIIAFGFLFILPLVLLATGLFIRSQRNRR